MKDQPIGKSKAFLDKQMSVYGVSELFSREQGRSGGSSGGVTPVSDGMNRYQLGIDGVRSRLSILRIQGHEHLSEPWRFSVQFTAPHELSMQQVLSQRASIALAPGGISDLINSTLGLSRGLMSAFNAFGGMFSDKVGQVFNAPLGGFSINGIVRSVGRSAFVTSALGMSGGGAFGETRALYGIVASFSQLSTSGDEALYEVTVSPRLQLLDNTRGNAIYQNQTVPQVVEEVLRKHELTGVDFRFELAETYPVKEYLTQWEESDLTFIRRLLADSGIWFRFESHAEHGCDVVVFGDSVQQYQDGPQASYRQPTGNNDGGLEAVWDMSVARKTVPQSVITQDYNYRAALSGMKSDVNEQKKDATTRGQHYLYAEHYRDRGEVVQSGNEQDDLLGQFGNVLDGFGGAARGQAKELLNKFGFGDENGEGGEESQEPEGVGQGAWYGKLRHQRLMTEQITISGKTTLAHLAPGQILTVNGSPIAEAGGGILIVSVESIGDRSQAYQLTFTGIPYDALRPYRPALLAWPNIGGTLPARVTSPDNDQYGYMDSHGRYRVKMDFDLNDSWRKGEESLWMRRASVYAGDTYGLHFPLIDGTEVAIAFTGGNPDRPYISHAMHDSRHPELVTAINHKRNVIRTPANNQLRMDDERGKEHIKVATEYGKTQLNMGHLVDAERSLRGQGFELRTDEWGAIRAEKGIQITTEPQKKAQGAQRDMSSVIKQLEEALAIARGLSGAAEVAEAVMSPLDKQEALQMTIDSLNAAGVALYGDEGVASLTPKSQQISAGENVIVTSGQDVAVSAFKKFTLAAGEMLSLFVQKLGIKLIAVSGRVQIQAQDDEMELTSMKNMFITAVDGKMVIHARKELLLMSGGAGVRIRNGVVEIIAPKRIEHKSPALNHLAGESVNGVMPSFQKGEFVRKFRLHVEGSPEQVIANRRFRVYRADGSVEEGVSDENGESPLLEMDELEQVRIEVLEVVRNG